MFYLVYNYDFPLPVSSPIVLENGEVGCLVQIGSWMYDDKSLGADADQEFRIDE